MKAGMLSKWIMALFLALTATALQAAQDPEALAKDTTKQLLNALQAQKPQLEKNPEKVYQLVDEILLPHFDFRLMAKLVLKSHWKKANDAQKERFTRAFRNLLVRTYAMSLVDYADQKINFTGTEGDASNNRRVSISAEVKSPGSSQTLKMVSEMYRTKEGDWKVYDVKVDEVSLVLNYRSSYDTEIRKNGLDGLIETLEKENAKAIAPSDKS